MRRLTLVFLSLSVTLSACSHSQPEGPEWSESLDLCQLAEWRPDAHLEIHTACESHAGADEELVRRLSLRNECLQSSDYSICQSQIYAQAEQPSLDRARRLSLAFGDEIDPILHETEPERQEEGFSRTDKHGGWKKELGDDGVLIGKYGAGILTTAWSAAQTDWLAYHDHTISRASNPDQKLFSRVTLASLLADYGHFELAEEILSQISSIDIERVLQPDWSLFIDGGITPDYHDPRASYEERNALYRYRRAVASIFAIQLHSGDKTVADRTFQTTKTFLNEMGGDGQQLSELMGFLLGEDVPNEQLFDKVFLGPTGSRGRLGRGRTTWESLANQSALAPLFEKRLDELDTELSGYSLSMDKIWRTLPNMSDGDFLRQPAELRASMAYYRTLLRDAIARRPDENLDADSKNLPPPDHVTFIAEDNEEISVPQSTTSRILEAGIGTYGVVAAREISNDQLQIIYLSSAIDPSGETGIAGYWLLEGSPEKGEWENPIYLGLRSFMPYTIDGFAPDRPLVPLKQADSLQLIGARQPLDLGSVTFTPLMLETAEPERGLLVFEVDKIKSDSDGDSLTDLFEIRVGLNPDDPDTDQDLIRDDRDSVPTRAYGGNSRDRDRAYALLAVTERHEDGAIVQAPNPPEKMEKSPFSGLNINQHLNSDSAPYYDPIPGVLYFESEFEGFGGLDLPYMLIVQTTEESKETSDSFAPHYPVSIVHQVIDPYSDRMIVEWSARWVGGNVLLSGHPEGGYEITILSSWIT